MQTLLLWIEKYVLTLGHIADPFGVKLHVHVAIFMINTIIAYLIIRAIAGSREGAIYEFLRTYAGVMAMIGGYIITIGFLWIKNH